MVAVQPEGKKAKRALIKTIILLIYNLLCPSCCFFNPLYLTLSTPENEMFENGPKQKQRDQPLCDWCCSAVMRTDLLSSAPQCERGLVVTTATWLFVQALSLRSMTALLFNLNISEPGSQSKS